MTTTTKPFLTLTASDLMTRDVAVLPRSMSLRTAAHLLSEMHVSGAPVVDDAGQCVGVLSATDVMHSVSYGERHVPRASVDPGSFHSAWQFGDDDMQSTDDVSNHMTADPITTSANTLIAELARQMIEAHIHRIIVVGPQHRPIGVVSSTDILAAVAHADRCPHELIRSKRQPLPE